MSCVAAAVQGAMPPAALAIAGGVVRQDRFPAQKVAFADGVIAFPDVEYANLRHTLRFIGTVSGR